MGAKLTFLGDTSLITDELALIIMMMHQYAYQPWTVFALKQRWGNRGSEKLS